MDAINLIKNYCPQDDAPVSLTVCSTLLKISAAVSTVFVFFVYTPWLLVASAASVSLDFFILQNPEFFQEADEWVKGIIGQFQAWANPPVQPVRNPAIDWANVKTFEGSLIVSSSLPSYHVGSDSRELYQHIKLEDGSPLVQTDGAFYCQSRLVFNDKLDVIDEALKDVFLPHFLPSDLLEGLKDGDRLKFLWKEQILFDLKVEDWALNAFHNLKGKVHKYLVEDDVPEDHHLLHKSDGYGMYLSPATEEIVPGVVGTQPCNDRTLPTVPSNAETLRLWDKEFNEDERVLTLSLPVPGCSADNASDHLFVFLDSNQLYAYFRTPKEILPEDSQPIWRISSIPDHRVLSLDLDFYLGLERSQLDKSRITMDPPVAGIARLHLPLLYSRAAAASA